MSEKQNNVVSINTPASPVVQFEIETLFSELYEQFVIPQLSPIANVLVDYISEKQLSAVSNVELMESMETEKKIKEAKTEIIDSCTTFLYASIDEWAESEKSIDPTLPEDNLSLVDNTFLEQKLAWQAAARQMEMCEQIQNLHNCESRLKDFTSTDSLQIPIGSMTLCKSFASALAPLNLNLKTTHAFLFLFAKHLKLPVAQMWQQADSDLTQMGLELNTPKTSSYTETIQHTESRQNANGSDGSNASDEASPVLIDQIAQQVVSKVETLIGQQINRTMSETGSDSLIVSPASYPAHDLASTLTSIQDELSQQTSVISNLSDSIKHALINHGISQHLSPRQEDLINLVGLLFEFIIDDHELPDVIKKTIGLLQIPVLKLALIDKDFLADREHPGRQLLNDMTSAGMRCQDSDDPVAQLIESTVMTIIHSFTDNPNIFSECLSEFNHNLLLISNNPIQPVDAESWGAESQDDSSVLTTNLNIEDSELLVEEVNPDETVNPVDDALDIYLSRHTIPEPLKELVFTGWKAVLQFSLEKKHSDERWFHRVNILDMLLWSLQENNQESIPDEDWQILKSYLLDLLNQVELNPFAIAEWFHAINNITNRDLDLEEEIVIQKKAEQEQEQELSHSQQVFNVEHNWEPEFQDSEFHNSVLDASDQDTLLQAFSDINMPVVGQWVEFIGKNDHRLRCKLATINLRTDRYVFVNKSGMKVAEWSGSELGRAISNHRVELQANHQFFDRALQAVMGNFLKF